MKCCKNCASIGYSNETTQICMLKGIVIDKPEKQYCDDYLTYEKKLEMDEIFIKALIKAQGKGYDI